MEVPKTTTVYPIAGINITEFSVDEYTKIENDLHDIQRIIEMEQIGLIPFMMLQVTVRKQINQIGSKVQMNIIQQRKKC